MTRRAAISAAMATLLALAIGCGGTAATVRDSSERDAVITFDCPIADAEVWINDRRIALIGDLPAGVALSPSTVHRLEVRHDDYHTHYAELELGVKERRVVRIELAPRFP